MNDLPPLDHEELIRRITRDVADGYDEEIEMEIEDRHPLPESATQDDGAAEKTTGCTTSNSSSGCRPSW